MDTNTNGRYRACGWTALLAALTLSAVPASAVATIHKCQGDNGAPIYQDEPCKPGKELRLKVNGGVEP